MVAAVAVVVSTLPPCDGWRECESECECVVAVAVAVAPSSGRRRSNGPARFCEYAARNCDLRTARTEHSTRQLG